MGKVLLVPLGTGTILPSFQAEGITPLDIERLQRVVNGEAMLVTVHFMQHFSRNAVTANRFGSIKANR